ncbi:MAG: AAA family ATPase [Deltaproteobacteria bacterium]|jgi:hypothetical protein|nr:AAA family ATPase [Deltaproteobacteria bacterium]
MDKNIYFKQSSFKQIQYNRYFYADKTRHIYNLIKNPQTKIFCRPSGFGKTLLLDTMAELFEGRKNLFSGLWIASSDYCFLKHPVIRLSLNIKNPVSPARVKNQLAAQLHEIACREELDISPIRPDRPFDTLAVSLFNKYNPQAKPDPADLNLRKVVILIDDYDAPILNSLDNPELATEIQTLLSSYARSLKELENYCRLILLAGQTKLGCQDRIQAGNFLRDISYEPEYATICGFTFEDLDRLLALDSDSVISSLVMKNQLKPGAGRDDLKEAILYWYDGYTFDGQTLLDDRNKESLPSVFNPYSILNFFHYRAFDSYWLKAHKPDFLSNIIAKNPIRFLENDFSGYSTLALNYADNPPLGILLFQTGYLTVKEVSASHNFLNYSLKVPNLEVSLAYRAAFLEILFSLDTEEAVRDNQRRLQQAIAAHSQVDLEEIFSLAVARLAVRPSWPGDYFYRLVFQWFIYSLGLESYPDHASGFNRAALVAEFFASEKNRKKF